MPAAFKPGGHSLRVKLTGGAHFPRKGGPKLGLQGGKNPLIGARERRILPITRGKMVREGKRGPRLKAPDRGKGGTGKG